MRILAMIGFAILLAGCAQKQAPPPKSTFAEDLELRMHQQQLHQDTLDRIHAQGVLEREVMTMEHNERMRRINARNRRLN